MSPDTHKFEPIPDELPMEDYRSHWLIFTVGQVVEVSGQRFKVRKITRKDLILRPLPGEAKDDE
jgi:hypothetical protein